ncbi:hypothetical protein EDD22DRAFT_963993 [Suillus occidentalis]|nr:hypothetical protein EDD22DRAFT_963993 [Suillus occidentalis]
MLILSSAGTQWSPTFEQSLATPPRRYLANGSTHIYFIQGVRYWTGFPAAILCKSHFNSMLVVLNARKSIRNQLKDHVPSLSTIPMNIVSESSTEPSEP